MKYFHTHFKLLLLFGVFAVFSGCKKDESYDPSKEMDDYFEGKVNGVNFEISSDWPCPAISGSYYPEDYLTFQSGYFVVTYGNCETDERISIGLRSNLREGVFTSCDTSDITGPRGEFIDGSISIPNSNQSILHATDCQYIRLEIIRIVEFSSHRGYVEGTLEATTRDSQLDTTIVISDVKFGYNY